LGFGYNLAMTEAPAPTPGEPMTPPAPDELRWQRLRRGFLWSAVGGLALYVVLAAWGDLRQLRAVLDAFPWRWMPLVLGLTLVNYGGRLLKWILYLRWLDVPIGRADAARVFGMGMTMVLTPGKAGELLKSVLVRRLAGTPVSVTAPAVMAERLTDGLAMLLLTAGGLFFFPEPLMRRSALLVLAALLAAILVAGHRPLALRLIGAAEGLPLVGRRVRHLHAFYDSAQTLLGGRCLAIAVGIGLVSWACEGLAYFLVLRGVGAAPGPRTALAAVFIFSISTVIGAVVATPGGLGGTEGALVTLAMRILGLGLAPAKAAALLARLATLWFGVGLGLLCVLRWGWMLEGGRPSGAGTRAAVGTADGPTG
jgi:uncharacterized protein (TIRG00374 family)